MPQESFEEKLPTKEYFSLVAKCYPEISKTLTIKLLITVVL